MAREKPDQIQAVDLGQINALTKYPDMAIKSRFGSKRSMNLEGGTGITRPSAFPHG